MFFALTPSPRRLFQRSEVSGNLPVETDFARAVAHGDRDQRGIFVDIEVHVFLDLPVPALVFGCSGSRPIHADWLPSPGVTRATGCKHTFCVRGLNTQP